MPQKIVMDIIQKIKQINESIALIISRLEKSGTLHTIDRDLLRQKLIAMYDLLEQEQRIIHSDIQTAQESIKKAEEVNEEKHVEPEPKAETLEVLPEEKTEEVLPQPEPVVADKKAEEEIPAEPVIVKEEEELKEEVEDAVNQVVAESVEIKEAEVIAEPAQVAEEKEPEKPVTEFKEDLYQAAQEQIRKKAVFEKFAKQEPSLNEKLAGKKEYVPLADSLQKGPIKDIKTAITLNMKLAFIRELYGGDQKEYNQMISFLTKCQNYTEAKLFLQEEKEKHPNWENKTEMFEQLMTLIHRRFRM
ncbi:MAG TPA: hypothetical protein P5050_02470 [Bacteroidia bacterium]|nr:hypothetical protein [Bacteroidia bacterium]HRS58065.1 hypothetical protein [Bacteroidia bacterium]HRU66917.1 hypothetical protein [Bacteroidia bacterium]